MPFELRPHQRRALRELHSYYTSGNRRGKYISACGTGKTVVMAHLPEVLKASTVVVFVPSLNLVEQLWDAFDAQLGGAFDGAIICSDNSRSRHRATSTGRPAYHSVEVHESDVWDSDEKALMSHISAGRGKVLHEPSDVADLLDRTPLLGPPTIIFSTYQSSHVLLHGVRLSKDKQIDLVLCDEAHRLASDRYDILEANDEDALEYPPRVMLKLLKAKRFLFATATPKSTAVKGGFGMDDTKLFGNDAHVYTYAQAVMDRVVAPFDIVIAHLDADDKGAADFLSSVSGSVTRLRPGSSVQDLIHHEDLRAAVVARILTAMQDKGSIQRALTYSSSIKRTQIAAEAINALNPGSAKAVSSKTKAADRRAAIAQFASGELPFIANCRLFGEGHDVPALDAISFVDPKTSPVDIIQAVGRACRIPVGSPTDKRATVVIPVDSFDQDQNGNLIRRSDGKAAVDTDKATKGSSSPFAIVQAVLSALDAPGVGLHDCSGDFHDALTNRFVMPRTPTGPHARTGPNPHRPSSPLRDKSGISVAALEALIGAPTPDENPVHDEDDLLRALPQVMSVAVLDPDPATQLRTHGAMIAAMTRYIKPTVVDKVHLTDAGFHIDATVLDVGRLSHESIMSEHLASAALYRTLRALSNAQLRNDYVQRCVDSSEDTIEAGTVLAGLPVSNDPAQNTAIGELLGYAIAYALHMEVVGHPPTMSAIGPAPRGLPVRVSKHARSAAHLFDRLAAEGWSQQWQLSIARFCGYPA